MEEFRFILPTEQCVMIDNMRVSVLTEHGQNREGYSLQSLHTHSYAEIFICTEGVLTIVTEKGHHPVEKGCGILVPPQVLHYLMPSDAPMQRITFGLSMARTTGGSRDLYSHFMQRFCGSDPEGKLRMLLPRDVADPWYTGNFDDTWRDVNEGCAALLEELGTC